MSKPTSVSGLWRAVNSTYKSARRIAIAVVGASVVLVGVAMLVLPGPAFVVIPTGLAILGLEFAWARRWLKMVKSGAQQGIDRLRAASAKTPTVSPEAIVPTVPSNPDSAPIHSPRNSRT